MAVGFNRVPRRFVRRSKVVRPLLLTSGLGRGVGETSFTIFPPSTVNAIPMHKSIERSDTFVSRHVLVREHLRRIRRMAKPVARFAYRLVRFAFITVCRLVAFVITPMPSGKRRAKEIVLRF